MTRTELFTALAYRTNKNATTLDTLTQARFQTFLDQRHRRVLSLPGIRHLREATLPVASVASQPDYVLPNIAKINGMRDPTTNKWTLTEMSLAEYRRVQPDTTITGTPTRYVWRSGMEVAQQPADASSVFVKSTSAADTTQVCYIEGAITGGYPMTASVTLTGVTAVDLSAAITTWIRIDKCYLSAAAAGTVTLHEDSGAGTELARITIGKTVTAYTGFSLWMTPSAVITYQVDVTRALTNFAQATDVPMLPDDFHDVILLGALCDEYQHLNDERYVIATREYQQRVHELQYWLAETATGQPGGLSRTWERPSQLGGWYPAGS